MTTPFDAFDQASSTAVVSAFGEQALISPRVSSAYVERTPDDDREAQSVWGVFSARSAKSDLRGQSRGSELGGTTRLTTAQSEFWIASDQAAALGFRPQKGDLLSLPNQPGVPTFAISAVEPTNLGDLNLLLVREDLRA